MLKTIKIPEEAYKDAKKLTKKLEEKEIITGLYKVKLSNAVSYAIKKALENIKKKEKFLSAAGGWSDMEGDKLINEIYKNRLRGTKWDINFD